MISDNTLFYDWFSFIFRIIALLILYSFLTLSSIATLDKYRRIDREDFSKQTGEYLGLPVPIIVLNSLILGIIGILIVYPISFSQEIYAIYELVSGSVLCILFVWLIIDITYHRPSEKSKTITLLISYGGFILLLPCLLFSEGIMLIFFTLFIIYINSELNGATVWIIWDIDPEKNKSLISISLISFIMVPTLTILCAIYPDPAIQAGLGVSAICNALTTLYYSELIQGKKFYLNLGGLVSFGSTIFISLFLPTPITGSSINSSLITALFMNGICFAYLLNLLIKRKFDFEENNRSKTLLGSLTFTFAFWILFVSVNSILSNSTGIIPIQGNFWSIITVIPFVFLSFMIAIFQTIMLFILTSIAAYDLQWVQDLVEWLKRQEEFFLYSSIVIFITLIIPLIVGGIWPSSWSVYPEMLMITVILWVAGLICLSATYFGFNERVFESMICYICYIGLGLAYGIVFAPMALGTLGLIGLVVISTILLGLAIFEEDLDLEYILPIIVAVFSMILGIFLMYLRLDNQITNPDTANLAGMFEWFFALLFAANAGTVAAYFIVEKRERVIGILILGIVLISLTHLILFVWDTRHSMALSYCWIATGVILIIPSLFVVFNSLWDALHEDKWSSVIMSILSAIIIMFASGTKFTPGLGDFGNSIIAIILAISLVVGYYILTRRHEI